MFVSVSEVVDEAEASSCCGFCFSRGKFRSSHSALILGIGASFALRERWKARDGEMDVLVSITILALDLVGLTSSVGSACRRADSSAVVITGAGMVAVKGWGGGGGGSDGLVGAGGGGEGGFMMNWGWGLGVFRRKPPVEGAMGRVGCDSEVVGCEVVGIGTCWFLEAWDSVVVVLRLSIAGFVCAAGFVGCEICLG